MGKTFEGNTYFFWKGGGGVAGVGKPTVRTWKWADLAPKRNRESVFKLEKHATARHLTDRYPKWRHRNDAVGPSFLGNPSVKCRGCRLLVFSWLYRDIQGLVEGQWWLILPYIIIGELGLLNFRMTKVNPSHLEMAKWQRLDNESIQLMLQLNWQLGKQPPWPG